MAESYALFSLRSKAQLLKQAGANALDRQAELTTAHKELEKQMAAEKSQKRILRRRGSQAAAVAPNQEPAANAGAEHSVPNAASPPGESSPTASGSSQGSMTLPLLHHLTTEQKDLSAFDQRIEVESELAAVYATWLTFIDVREKAFLHGVFISIFWILLIAIGVLVSNYSVQRFFSDVTPERRELHTMRTVALVVIQALGVGLILLVIFGVPNNFATFLALATAGLTVAMKDFIVGFVGWFVLIGRDGIRPGPGGDQRSGRRSARGGPVPHRTPGDGELVGRSAPDGAQGGVRQQLRDRRALLQFLHLGAMVLGRAGHSGAVQPRSLPHGGGDSENRG